MIAAFLELLTVAVLIDLAIVYSCTSASGRCCREEETGQEERRQ